MASMRECQEGRGLREGGLSRIMLTRFCRESPPELGLAYVNKKGREY